MTSYVSTQAVDPIPPLRRGGRGGGTGRSSPAPQPSAATLIVCAAFACCVVLLSNGAAWAQSEESTAAAKQSSTGDATAASGDRPAPPSQSTVWDNLAAAWTRERGGFLNQTRDFVSLAGQGVGLALIIGLPIGITLTRIRRLAQPSISALAVIQTIPSLALLGLLIPLLGIGRAPALAATVVYSLLPVVMNTYVGVVQVDPAVRDAARGMGMTPLQILWKVELPLALPVILAGVRTSIVYAIGVITVCALVAAGGLGEYITRGLSRIDNGLVLLGALPILLLTLLAFWSVGGIAVLAKRNASAGLGIALVLIAALAGYAVVESLPTHAAKNTVVIGCKNFTENIILADIMRQMLEVHTDLHVETRYGLGSNLAYRALRSGDTDLYPEYTGTLLTAVDALNRPVPKDKSAITELVRREMAERFDMVLLKTFGLNNTYAMSVGRELAEKYNLHTIGDLARVPDLRVVVADEFLDRPDGWPGLAETYGIKLDEQPRTMTPELMYVAMREGQADLCSGFATDWQILAYDLVVLEDPKEYFPSYHAAPLVRREVLERYPIIRKVLNRLAGTISDETIRSMNAAVAVDKRSEADVAREFLIEHNLIPRPRDDQPKPGD
jgi:osmoprotectant transport system permease protein